ncbi:MAG: hypothetical protein QM820_28615 [Minicystis sp.]
MRTTIIAPLFVLAIACGHAPAEDAPTPDMAPAEITTPEPAFETKAPGGRETGRGPVLLARAPAPSLKAASILATDGAVPAAMTLKVQLESEHRWAVRVQCKGRIVALRQGDSHASGDGEAALANVMSSAREAPIVWETTDPATLVTTRGLVELDTEGDAHLRLAEAPAVVASETHRRHACNAHEDGVGGFTVICRVRGFASAVSLTRENAHDGVWATSNIERLILRFDLAARTGTADAIAIGYADGTTGVVVRAETSRVAGEDRPAIVIQSAERKQPVLMLPHPHSPPHIRHPFPDEVFF